MFPPKVQPRQSKCHLQCNHKGFVCQTFRRPAGLNENRCESSGAPPEAIQNQRFPVLPPSKNPSDCTGAVAEAKEGPKRQAFGVGPKSAGGVVPAVRAVGLRTHMPARTPPLPPLLKPTETPLKPIKNLSKPY